MKRYIELLAPAKNKETALAAIDHGADAVYMGAERFGARAAAGNSVEDIAEVVRYARRFGVKVYVTLNTLLHDEELPVARDLALTLHHRGVSAFIIQDMRLYDLLKDTGIHLHSSTQMDNRSADIVATRQAQGFEQTVLARELTLQEIADIHRHVPEMLLEVFVHGAICVCYNGRCFASEVCYGRSANRGECAQFCRMPYDLEDADGNVLQRSRYLLSMRDMNRTHELEQLLDAGVTSLKIEGRLKDVAYVKNITAWYRGQLDTIMRRRPEFVRASYGTETFSFTPDPNRTFNRGYTNYFLAGRTSDLCSYITPKSMGERVGFVKEIRRDHLVVAGTAQFHNGDGLCYQDGGELIGFRINRADNNHLYPFRMPRGLRDGVVLYRNQDEAMEKILAGKTAERRLRVDWTLHEDADGHLLLTIASEDGRRAQKTLDIEYQEARTDQTEGIRQVLSKLGDTIYVAENVEISLRRQWFVPRSILADWRRQMIDMLEATATVSSDSSLGNEARNTPATTSRPEERYTSDMPLMTCRYCIRHQLGQCKREKSQWRDPLFLRGADDRRFRLQFDCNKCMMNVYAE